MSMMAVTSGAFSILEFICIIEESMGVLYHAYANQFSEHADFWRQFAEEKSRHAADIVELLREDAPNALAGYPMPQAVAAYHSLLEWITAAVQRVTTISMDQAVRDALYLERTFAEQHLPGPFLPDSPQVHTILDHLADETVQRWWKLMALQMTMTLWYCAA